MDLLAIQRALWVACLVAQVLLIGAIFQRRIVRSYRFFVAYLVVEAAAGVVLLQIPFRSAAYAHAYQLYELSIVVLRAGAVAELFERVCAHFPVIGRIRFALASTLLALTALVSVAAVRPTGGFGRCSQMLAIYVHQFETTVLAGSLLLMWWFLTRFMSLTPAVRGNVALHWKLLTVYFAVSGVVTLLQTGTKLTIAILWPLTVATLACDLACFLVWIRGLTPAGELPPPLVLSVEEARMRRMLRRAILQHVKDARREHVERL